MTSRQIYDAVRLQMCPSLEQARTLALVEIAEALREPVPRTPLADTLAEWTALVLLRRVYDEIVPCAHFPLELRRQIKELLERQR